MGAAERTLVGKLAAWARIHPADGCRYGSAWQLVLEEGRWWRPAPFPRELGRRRGRRAQDCYRQAARLAGTVEGFADPGIGAVMGVEEDYYRIWR
ncbi:hypothetical protein LP52_23345 [Streptomonospora alba]|uniref:Uncharacterized protein n=2 Tax=Streptomonospora alba TaxID=183763 RepID=A0A0C2J5Q3_9ACTN|nr:hypothetical protein LP52_23345 [Streptomonospora alba]